MLGKSSEVRQKENEGEWNDLSVKSCFYRQRWTKDFSKRIKIKGNWTRLENFDIFFACFLTAVANVLNHNFW